MSELTKIIDFCNEDKGTVGGKANDPSLFI
jgi:hypothetical protein